MGNAGAGWSAPGRLSWISFPQGLPRLRQGMSAYTDSLCAERVFPASIRCNLSVQDLWFWGRVSTITSDFFYRWKRLSCWKKLPPWSIFQPSVTFSPLILTLLFRQGLVFFFCTPELTCAGRLRGKSFCWGKLFIFEFSCSLDGVCLLCISCSPFYYLVWPILLTKRRQWWETEVVISEQFLCLPPLLPSDLLASLCSCFMAGKIEGEQS